MNGPQTDAGSPHRRQIVAAWLLVVAGLVFVMVVLGGATRLTHSGLSMVEWRPITGWLPPLNDAEWQQAFREYQKFPEFQKINPGMTLAGYKEIFWLEYVHRLSGRLLGIVFVVPFGIFLLRRWIDRPLARQLAALLLLGALQGLLGWYMVKSGLVSRPDVSQYRLVAHLGLALAIYGLLIWIALGLMRTPPRAPAAGRSRHGAFGLAVLVFCTILSGGFVAGTDAGFGYNTFPLMNGELIPDALFPLRPAVLSLFEDPTTIQFGHRLLATFTLLAVLVYGWRARIGGLAPGRCRMALHALVISVLGQYALGVATLLMVIPVPLGVAHQSGAVVVWTTVLWLAFETRRQDAEPEPLATMAKQKSRNRPAIAG